VGSRIKFGILANINSCYTTPLLSAHQTLRDAQSAAIVLLVIIWLTVVRLAVVLEPKQCRNGLTARCNPKNFLKKLNTCAEQVCENITRLLGESQRGKAVLFPLQKFVERRSNDHKILYSRCVEINCNQE